jgi:hypothetical protein
MTDAVRRRLRAPVEDGAALIEPPLGTIANTLGRNLFLIRGCKFDCQGLSFNNLIARARGALLAKALAFTGEYRDVSFAQTIAPGTPFVLCGHQPELFHPGVWFKNFLLSSMGASLPSVPINLIVDTDVVRSTSIRVPTNAEGVAALEHVPFDVPTEGIPFEEREIRDSWLFESFEHRLTPTYRTCCVDGNEPYQPLAQAVWTSTLAAAARSQQGPNLGLALAEGRHVLESLLGLKTLELPLSVVAQSQSFRWFAAHLLAHLPRLQAIYNAALDEYRHINHIRSDTHPVPRLEADDEWRESPLLLWTRENPRRRRLFVRQQQDSIVISDRKGLRLILDVSSDLSADKAIEQLAAAEARGIKLRPRALITTMYARLVLSDLFIHGIGGAKYDELTDLIIRRFFGIEPPAYVTATATFRLPIERPDVSLEDVRSVAQKMRDVRYRPESFLRDPRVMQDAALAQPLEDLANEKRDYLAKHDLRHCPQKVFDRLDRLNRAMHDLLRPVEEQLRAEHAKLVEQWKQSQLLSSREFSFCLFPSEILPARLLDLCKVSS